MIELFAYPLTGLYDECHHIDYLALWESTAPQYSGPHSLQNLNNLWWKQATSNQTLDLIIERINRRSSIAKPETRLHSIINADPSAFKSAVQEAVHGISNLAAGPKALFSHLETLQIFCNVYSDFISYPLRLSLQEGILMNELDTEVLIREALDSKHNFYLQFLESFALPVLEDAKADILWLVGAPKSSLIAMAILQRAINPNCHISIIGHSTEYYSLNKIENLLQRNDLLFNVIDSIVLDDFEHTIPQLRAALEDSSSLDSVPNLLYKDLDGHLRRTPYLKNSTKTLAFNSSMSQSAGNLPSKNEWTDFSRAVTVKLWPNSKCFWSSCNFCAINKKYNTLPVNDFSQFSDAAEFFRSVERAGRDYIWSIDEAIPPENLDTLSSELIAAKNTILWETRSKIHVGFTSEVCQRLYSAGLREIRLGLESASPRILVAMGKHSEDWSIDLVERIVSNFHNAGISVHFPTIVGFPTETKEERQETFDFLKRVTQKYPSATFNINILGLDVGSKLFQKYENFGITEIRWPCDPKYFLGNLVDWNSSVEPFQYESLDATRNFVMRDILYPWMPNSAQLPVYIFYRLAETSRATLVWKAIRERRGDWRLSDFSEARPDGSVALSDKVVKVVIREQTPYSDEKRFLFYDWRTHHQFEVEGVAVDLVEQLRLPFVLSDIAGDELYMTAKSLYDMGLVVNA